jgi:hypothetical protein
VANRGGPGADRVSYGARRQRWRRKAAAGRRLFGRSEAFRHGMLHWKCGDLVYFHPGKKSHPLHSVVLASRQRRTALSFGSVRLRYCWNLRGNCRSTVPEQSQRRQKSRSRTKKRTHSRRVLSSISYCPPTVQTTLRNAKFQIHADRFFGIPAWVTYVQTLRLNFVITEAKSGPIRSVQNVDNKK